MSLAQNCIRERGEEKQQQDFIKPTYLHKRSLIPWAHAVLKFGSNETTANFDNA